ncbi:hypothetical protein [Burkholderia sp. ABCPW 14]|uniref:hypothetical protein n=1 Tax=Burkholderia sp. ABCPW 14 TaxID=1637860 RepID=UPI000AA510B2|nr:hypothetical protein [Burkholderia sp. ABCPW 14]
MADLNGFQSGTAQSDQLNKVWRQSSIMAAVVAQFIVNQTGQNATDDGTTATLLSNLATAVAISARQNPVLADTGTANTYAVANLAAFPAYPTASGLVIDVSIANANTGASTLNVDGLGVKPIYGLALQPLQGGELVVKGVACFQYVVASTVNSGNGAWILTECAGGAQQVAAATQSNHALQLGQATGRLLRTSVYTNVGGAQYVSVNGGAATTTGATTFSAQALTTRQRVTVVGGGASGGPAGASSSGSAATGGGGGAGGIAVSLMGPTSGTAITVGTGGPSNTGATGNNGGTSSFGALLSATGGSGGNWSTNVAYPSGQGGGAGGTGTGGNVYNGAGGPGAPAMWPNSGMVLSGNGGGTQYSGGALGAIISTATSVAGTAGGGYGAGGSGGGSNAGAALAAGGAGYAGVAIIEEFA